jgi:hypothetical protein
MIKPEFVPRAEVVIPHPSWKAVLPLMIAGIENGTTLGRKIAIEELNRMADLADAYVALTKKESMI